MLVIINNVLIVIRLRIFNVNIYICKDVVQKVVYVGLVINSFNLSSYYRILLIYINKI